MEHKLKVTGMHCNSCEKVIGMAIEDVKGAKLISVNSKTGDLKVDTKDASTLDAVKAAIVKEGYKVA